MRLSDLSGILIAGDAPPYLTCYSLPSRTHFAIARTWPDPKVARKGCVITRTLLVEMAEWRGGIPAASLIAELAPVDRSNLAEAGRPREVLWSDLSDARPLPLSLDLSVAEFARAYFLEGRHSIVWPLRDQPQDSIDRIAIRLADFLWPARRANLTLCTYALQPRQAGGSPFQLMFAPAEALSRFRDFPEASVIGEAEGVARETKDARADRVIHTVSQVLNGRADAKFSATLNKIRDVLPDKGDALLRVATLEDLERKSVSTPNALVAILDVWRALAPRPEEAINAKVAAAEEVLARARSLPSNVSLDLLSALLQRLIRPEFRTLIDQRAQARAEIIERTAQDPRAAISWLDSEKRTRQELTALIASGLAQCKARELLALLELDERSPAGPALLHSQPQLAAQILSAAGASHLKALARIEAWTLGGDSLTRMRVARRLLSSPHIVHSDALLAEGIQIAESGDVAGLLSASNDRDLSAAGEASIAQLVSMFPDQACAAFMRFPRFRRWEAELFASTVNAERIGAALDVVERSGTCEAAWLAAAFVLRRQPRSYLMEIFLPGTDRRLFRTLWLGLLHGCEGVASAFEQLLDRVFDQDIINAIRIDEIARVSDHQLRATVLRACLDAVLPAYLSGGSDLNLMRSWANETIRLGEGPTLDAASDQALRRSGSDAQPERIWALLEVRLDGLVVSARGLHERLTQAISLTRNRHTSTSVAIWARILERATSARADLREAAALTSYNAAIGARRLPVSPILVLSFPVLHAGLPGRRRETVFFGFVPLPVDIDKRKDARRSLVEAFLESSWPSDDLAFAAHRAGVLQNIVGLLQRRGRTDYIQKMISNLEAHQQPQLASRVRNLARERPND